MKKLKNKLISCGLAALMACTFVGAAMQRETLVAYAASNEEFLSDVALVYEDSVEDAQKAIEGTEWKLYNKDLNPNNDVTILDDGVYLIYKTSTNVEDAITDLRVMDMYGGYTATNYQSQLQESRKQYDAKIDELRIAANEFKILYEAGDDMAKLAYRQMNHYKDTKTANGTETDKLMGDFFLNLPTDNNKIIQVMMEGNSILVANLISLLAIGISGGTSLAARIENKYAMKDTLTDAEYHDSASALAKSFDSLKVKLLRYETMKEEYDVEDEEMSDEELQFVTEYASTALLMQEIKYGDTTLAEFIKGKWETKDLYPIVAALTAGQEALAGMGQIETVLKYNSPSKSIEELTKAVEEVEAEMKDADGNISVYDVYMGVDREIFKGNFAMTTAAERQQALTGETWDWGNAATRTGGAKIAYIITAALDFAIFAVGAGVHIAYKVMCASYLKTGLVPKLNAANAFWWDWGGVTIIGYGLAIAITLILLGTYGITTWINYYHPDYLEIPNTLIDVRETDLGDKYIKYSVAKVFNGDKGEENADFNAYEAKEWIALYYTKDANAGNCLTPNFVYRENSNTVSKRHQGVSMFGESNAFNLNSHVYNKDAVGVYLSVRYSTAKKAAADRPTVVGTMLGGAYYVLAAVGGVGLGIGGTVLFQYLKKKKKEETVVEETTTGE